MELGLLHHFFRIFFMQGENIIFLWKVTYEVRMSTQGENA